MCDLVEDWKQSKSISTVSDTVYPVAEMLIYRDGSHVKYASWTVISRFYISIGHIIRQLADGWSVAHLWLGTLTLGVGECRVGGNKNWVGGNKSSQLIRLRS